MKKIYLSALAAALVVSTASAQQTLSDGPHIKRFPGDNNISNVQPKALGISVWSNDFSTPADWTVDNAGQAGADYGWSIDGTIDADWWYDALTPAFTGGGNFAELGNGDYFANTQATMVEYTMTTAANIDLSVASIGTDDFLVTFEQTGARFNDLQEVQISTDGTNYTTIYDCLGSDVFLGNNPEAEYDNVETVNVLVPNSMIASSPSTVTLRFRWTSNFPGDSALDAWTTFGWFVDNVQVMTLPDNDLAFSNLYWGTAQLPYYRIPNEQIAPIDFSVNVANNGSADQTNVSFELSVNGTPTLNTTPATITSGTEDSLFVTFTPTADATYDFVRTLSVDQTDDIPTNNTFPTIPTVTVGGDIYQRDLGGTFGTGGGSSTINGNEESVFEAGTYYDIFAADDLIALDLGIGSTATNEGKEVYGILYSLDANNDFQFEGQTPTYVIGASDLGAVRILNFDNPISLNPGTTYFAAIGCTEGITYATSGTSAQGLSLIFYGGMSNPVTDGNFFTTNTPVVRMNFAGNVGLEEASTNVNLGQNVPNPAVNNTKVSYTLANNAEVTFTVTNIAGQVIETMDLGSVNAGTQSIILNTANYAAGVYNYTISVDGVATTKRMIIQK